MSATMTSLTPSAPSEIYVVGKPLNLRAERRFEEAWRRQAAQAFIARVARGFLTRSRMRKDRENDAAKLLQRAARMWLSRRKLRSLRCHRSATQVQSLLRRYLAEAMLQQLIWASYATTLQKRWRGVLGRRLAQNRRQQRSASSIQCLFRGWAVRRRLQARRKLLKWWQQMHRKRVAKAVRIQASFRRFQSLALYQRLKDHVLRPSEMLMMTLGLARFRRQVVLLKAHVAAKDIQRQWRGYTVRRFVELRRQVRRALRCWRRIASVATTAAVVLQRVFRGHVARVRAKKLQEQRVCSILVIQASCRAYCAQAELLQRRRLVSACRLQEAWREVRPKLAQRRLVLRVTAVQAAWRGLVGRRTAASLRRFQERKRRWLAASAAAMAASAEAAERELAAAADARERAEAAAAEEAAAAKATAEEAAAMAAAEAAAAKAAAEAAASATEAAEAEATAAKEAAEAEDPAKAAACADASCSGADEEISTEAAASPTCTDIKDCQEDASWPEVPILSRQSDQPQFHHQQPQRQELGASLEASLNKYRAGEFHPKHPQTPQKTQQQQEKQLLQHRRQGRHCSPHHRIQQNNLHQKTHWRQQHHKQPHRTHHHNQQHHQQRLQQLVTLQQRLQHNSGQEEEEEDTENEQEQRDIEKRRGCQADGGEFQVNWNYFSPCNQTSLHDQWRAKEVEANDEDPNPSAVPSGIAATALAEDPSPRLERSPLADDEDDNRSTRAADLLEELGVKARALHASKRTMRSENQNGLLRSHGQKALVQGNTQDQQFAASTEAAAALWERENACGLRGVSAATATATVAAAAAACGSISGGKNLQVPVSSSYTSSVPATRPFVSRGRSSESRRGDDEHEEGGSRSGYGGSALRAARKLRSSSSATILVSDYNCAPEGLDCASNSQVSDVTLQQRHPRGPSCQNLQFSSGFYASADASNIIASDTCSRTIDNTVEHPPAISGESTAPLLRTNRNEEQGKVDWWLQMGSSGSVVSETVPPTQSQQQDAKVESQGLNPTRGAAESQKKRQASRRPRSAIARLPTGNERMLLAAFLSAQPGISAAAEAAARARPQSAKRSAARRSQHNYEGSVGWI
eukprot:TRINITY_DN28847_c2_g2_i1.p1 TRINITY_DN28847_c2_g2~~TRINITY_DN28847_c2_g2_i1.p1  ORF type:complete len:1152 (-),score=266.77 TRINITY_DN28847_c2_g2_i1:363-3635(-)